MSEQPRCSTLRKILIVEDDFLIADSIAEEARTAGYEVLGPAYSLADGLALAAERPDGAILDVRLSGSTTSHEIAERLVRDRVVVVFYTGGAKGDLAVRFPGASIVDKALPSRVAVARLSDAD